MQNDQDNGRRDVEKRTVTTQAELDQALADGVSWIDIRSERGVWIEVWKTDSSTVTAYGSSTVRAYGSSTVTAYGSSTVRATKLCAVHLHSASVKVDGGVVLDHTKVDDFMAAEWCEYHGVEVTDGVATLYKAVNDAWTTDRGTDYSPGSLPSCEDFRDTDECGGGLHFGPTPTHALAYFTEASRFVSVGVEVATLRPITGGTAKAKAPRVVRACVEVDVLGRAVVRETAAA